MERRPLRLVGQPGARPPVASFRHVAILSLAMLLVTVHAGAGPVPGRWVGVTEQGLPISFTVNEAGQVVSLSLQLYINGAYWSFGTGGPLIPNSNGSFGFVFGPCSNLSLGGTFVSATKATGVVIPRTLGPCSEIVNTTWTAFAPQTPASIFSQPVSPTIRPGQTATLTTSADGTAPITYQWYRGAPGDTSAPVGTGSSYTTPALAATTVYWVRASNPWGSADSIAATITVTLQPLITRQPFDFTVGSGQPALLCVVVSSVAASVSYHWFLGSGGDTSQPAGETASNCSLTPPLTVTSRYWVQALDVNGSADSNAATVTVVQPIVFVVNSTADADDARPDDGVCAAAGGACTLRAAIREAASSNHPHAITLPAGTYTLSAGELDIYQGKRLTINGAGRNRTIIDANRLTRVFELTGPTLVLNDLTVQNGRFDNGIYASGGCFDLADWFVEQPPVLVLNRVDVRGCAAHFGGAIAATGQEGIYKAISVTDTTIQQNSAITRGGGIYAGVGVLVAVTRSAIASNHAESGAGLFGQGALTLANTTISSNTSSSAAGAIEQNGGTLMLTNVTIAANTSGTGGAIQVSSGSAQVRNSIVANNTGDAPTNCSATTVLTDLGHNLEFPGTTCGFAAPSDRRADPVLGPLAANGAATMTHALGAGSPAKDAGNDGACAAAPVSGVDQNGRSRPRGVHCDMGAFEAAAPFTDDPLVSGITPVRGVHVTELRVRIDALRVRAGLSPYSWTDLNLFGGVIAARHIQEMRTALIEAYPVEQSPLVFTDQPLVPGHTIRAVHLAELRAAVSAIE